MISNDQIFKYLESKIPNFIKTKKSGRFLFSCPNNKNHLQQSQAPSATFIPESNKINCLTCPFEGTMLDAIRALEPDKKNKSDAEITEYLINSMQLDTYKELDTYQIYEWSLVPILKNSKMPFEKDWVSHEHRDKVSWIKWLNNGLNLGLNCTQSKVIVVDVDFSNIESPERTELITMLTETNTLMQETPHGKHFVFQVNEIPQQVNIGGLKIDTRCAGGQIVISPSAINNSPYKWINLGAEIKQMPIELKDKILAQIKDIKKIEESTTHQVLSEGELPELKNNNLDGCCNDTFIRMGGIFINKFTVEQTELILNTMNRNLLEHPMSDSAIRVMLSSLSGYKISEEGTQEKSIYEYMKLIQNDVSAKDVMESLRLPRAIVDRWLSTFVKEGKAVRMARGRYQYKERVEWSDKTPELVEEYQHKIPLFNSIAIFQDKDVLLLGARTNDGKTTIALNMIAEMVKQGLKPYYIYSEAGSRFQKTSRTLGIAGDYYHTYHENPLAIELEYNSFSIIDWLHLEHKENTDTVLKHLNNELQRKGGILVIFTQLKQNYDFFAPNLIDHYPTFAAKYIQDSENKTEGHWDIQKIKEPRGNYCTYILPCSYTQDTKVFKVKDLT
jgi:hypothetical protein